MTSDLFYAILKLVSGEEILAKVCAFVENKEVLLVLDHPIIVTLLPSFRGQVPFVKVNPWISLSDDTTHIIRRKDVITMTEIKDANLAGIHQKYVEQMSTSKNSSVKSNAHIIKIQDARKSLEKLYNQESHSNSD